MEAGRGSCAAFEICFPANRKSSLPNAVFLYPTPLLTLTSYSPLKTPYSNFNCYADSQPNSSEDRFI